MRRALRAAFWGTLTALGVAIACTPSERRAAVPALTESACVLLHGFAPSGTTDDVCATAEDLAPFVAEMLAARAAEPARSSLAVAVAELPAPKASRRAPRRRCVSWVAVSSLADASLE